MNRLMNQLELKFGKYAIERLPMYMLICYAIGYLMQVINPNIIDVLALNPYAILHGQVWRLVSWILIPPESSNLFFVLIMLYFYYSIGMTLERTWGAFQFNFYIFSGMFFTVLGAFCMYCFVELFQSGVSLQQDAEMAARYGELAGMYGGSYYYLVLSRYFSTYYINMSIFLAFAATYPDMQVLLMFFIPIKVKVLGIIYAAMLLFEAVQLKFMGLFVIGASLLNFVIFFISTRKRHFTSPQMRARQKQFRQQMRHAQVKNKVIAKHKCAICGRTSEEYPDLEFRFCSKCAGNYEYCQEHIFTHRHIERKE
ncbi:MAG: hypothetical protein IJV59_06815 [Eubacterium sp.]|nr:hypothetical protein [Eubacterium sp.]MBR1472255.1 hypothetical protein [Lachnospiraceae bacterium]